MEDYGNPKVAFLVVSCDKYSDLWDPFFTLLDKYWPDITFKIYLLSNKKNFSWPDVNLLKIGEDISYADNLSKALEKISEEWIFLWLEDLFISKKVDNMRLKKIINDFIKMKGGYLNFAPDMPLSYEIQKGKEIGHLPKGIRYRSAIGATLYKKNTLNKLLVKGASAWDLDKSKISDSLDEQFFALNKASSLIPPIKYINVLIRGRWAWNANVFLKSEGFQKLLSKRKFETFFSFIYAKLYNFYLSLYKNFDIYWK